MNDRGTVRLALLLILVALLYPTSVSIGGARDLAVVRINPSGDDVPPTQQIVFKFNRPVVPVGRMQRDALEIPIEIHPDPGCEWRWLDTSSLACQMGEANRLAPATRYNVVVRPGIRAEDGTTLAEPHLHTFLTQRPKVGHAWFESWLSPGTPKVRVTFDQPVTRASIEEHMVFIPGRGETVAVDVQAFDDGGETWYVSPVSELPSDQEIAFHVEPGLIPRRGSEPGIEDRHVSTFRTFPAPRFIGIECVDISGDSLKLVVGQVMRPEGGCDPLRGVSLLFSSPVIKEILGEHLRFDPDLAGDRTDYDPWASLPSYSQLRGIRRTHLYRSYLPEKLRAHAEYHITGQAAAVRDEFDRPLVADIDFRFRTSHRRPDLHLGHPASVLESRVETHLPVIVTNLESVNVSFDRITAEGVERARKQVVAVPAEQDVAYRFPLQVRDWLDGKSGAVVGHLTATPPLRQMPDWFFSEVTPFQVHVKLGHYNTIVWVTDLQTGEPVAGAEVDVIEMPFAGFSSNPKSRSVGSTDSDGLAQLAGVETLDPELKLVSRWRDHGSLHLFVRVRKAGEIALVPLAREFQIQNLGPNKAWVSTYLNRRHGHLRTWGATAQGIYRAGDTIQYKIYVRNDGNERLELPPSGRYTLEVFDPADKVVHQAADLVLNDFGAVDGAFQVPKNGAVGWYRFVLTPDFVSAGQSWTPLSVLVSDFTPAPFRVTPTLSAEFFEDGDPVSVDTRAALHSGGPYVDAQTRVTAILRSSAFRPEDPRAKNFRFDTGYGLRESIHKSEASLDRSGESQTAFDVRAQRVLYGTLTVESAVRDDRGKYVAGLATARFAARDRFLGVRQTDWVLEAGEPAEVLAVVTDAAGKLVAGTEIAFNIERRITKASRVKGAGNAYLTHYVHSWESESACAEVSGDEAVTCRFTPKHPGVYRVIASIDDTVGRPLRHQLRRWVVGPGQVVWEEPPGHHLQIFPENETLRVGDKARYLVQNPYPGARALITLERNGVIRRWTENLEDSTAVIEFPVGPDLIPGFYLSVVVTSPRVEAPPSANDVDLGKPGFRMGYVRTGVRDPYKELQVEVTPAAEVYKPRETVTVDIVGSDGQGAIPRMEYAVAVLDESVLDLLGQGTAAFDPYAGFYDLGPLDLWNYNLLKNLIGIQKFEKKGANPGGGGGGDSSMRSRFKFVSYWNPSIVADDAGRAQVRFEVPDNLTGWRVLVMAVTPDDKMGLGQAGFKVNRPTEIRPALPNQVIEGDRFEARFTVMNRTDDLRVLEVRGKAEGQVSGDPRLKTSIDAESYRRYVVSLPVRAGRHGDVRFTVEAGDDEDTDGLTLSVPVRKRKALRAAATYGTTTDDEVVENLLFPPGIRPDVGRVSVVASPTVIGGLAGAFEYLRNYPYLCWEQRLTKGVMAAHYVGLREYLPVSLEWADAGVLPLRTLESAANFQAPNGGMVYYSPQERYVSPYLSAYTALAFEWLRERGHTIPAGVESRLHDYLLQLLRRDVFPTFYSKGMASSVRAVALAALAPAGKVTLADCERYRSHVPQMDLFGRAHYLQALQHVPGSEALRREVQDRILGHAEETGGKMAFVETLDDGYARILHSELRTSCSILTALVEQGSDELTRTGAGDLPFKMVRAITQSRKQRDRWENTQENMFCMNALIEYAEAYEQESPLFTVAVDVDGRSLGTSRFEGRRGDSVEFERPIDEQDPGQKSRVRITREGSGRLYYAVRMFYSPSSLEAERIHSGIEVRREYSVERNDTWVRLEDPLRLEQGELVRVDLFVRLPAPRNFVVVDDPIPGGLEPVNRDLATASTVDADKAQFEFPPDSYYRTRDDWRHYAYTRWSFYHQELRHDSARFYSEYLPAGNYHLSYVAQVIVPGEFTVLPLHAEEMYDPDVYGLGLPGKLVVEEMAP